jgi:RNA polymerase sigma-70 factor (ECF subfamily)
MMDDLRIYTDPELVRLAQEGNLESFGILVRRYENKIYRVARQMTETHEDAEDVLQEAFVSAFRSISGFKGESAFPTWLYRIAVNVALMKRRARKVIVQSLDEPTSTDDGEIPKDISDDGYDPLTILIGKESQEILDRAIAGLSPVNRDVFVLRHIEGLSTEETGETLGISLPAVKSRLYRACLALREHRADLVRDEAAAPCAV